MNRLACVWALAGSALLAAAPTIAAPTAPSKSQGPLQLAIISPDANSIADRVALDVSFRGGSVERVELYLDGTLAAQRQLGTAQTRGVITFSLDAVQLTEGTHDVLVKAFGPDGKPATASTKLRIPGIDPASPVRIAYPQNGLVVSGVIPIRVTLSTDLQKDKPYVSFFVDKEFKSLKNFPPYEYNWDTTRVPNGWHVLEAMTATPDAATPTKARSIHVNVNNPGGQTRKFDNINDLAANPNAKTPKGPAKIADGSPKIPDAVTNRLNVGGVAPNEVGTSRASEPGIYGVGAASSGPTTAPKAITRTGHFAGPSPVKMGSAVQEPKGRLARQSAKTSLPPVSTSGVVMPVLPGTRDVNPGLAKAEPGDTLESIAKRSGYKAEELRKLNGLKPGQQLPKGSIIVPRAGSFDVAFDGQQIAFDVPPRVDPAGIKLAPFRQIFEHTGGRLYWFNDVKTVRAVNSSREIEIKVGNANALVNNQNVTMEKKPFIETGRTIVPLTFIRDALNAKISYDEKTGRLLIESNK